MTTEATRASAVAPLPPEAAPRAHLSTTRPLDVAVAATTGRSAPWALAAVFAAVGIVPAIVLLIIVVFAIGGTGNADVLAGYGLVGEALYGVVVFAVAWPVARRYGGYRRTFGFDSPRLRDIRLILGWSVIQIIARVVVISGLTALIPYLQDRSTGNLTGVENLGPLGVVLLTLGAVVCAPIVEEFATRGVLLRAFLRRVPFAWAALYSSLIFGALHILSADNLASIIVLVPAMTVFGFLQCVFVRQSGRLGPAMGVHGLTNLVSITIVVVSANS